MNKINNLSICFPVYNDRNTIEIMVTKCIQLRDFLLLKDFEIVIVNDCSLDDSAKILNFIEKKYDFVKVIHHDKNMGYGFAVRNAINNAKYEYILLTDGDNEYDIFDIIKFIKIIHRYDLIITFRYKKMYSNYRIFLSYFYNLICRFLYNHNFRDISTGLRLLRKSFVKDLELISTSPFLGAELVIKAMLSGHSIGEVGIQTFPRKFGSGAATSFKNILMTIKEMLLIRKIIFSENYQKPALKKDDDPRY